MKLSLLVLIVAVTVNCLVTAINAETSSIAAAVPYIDMLLPPFEDKAEEDSSKNSAKTLAAAKNINATVETVSKTKTTTITSTIKPITNDAQNNLPELSLEPFLPPLFEAKTEQEDTKEVATQRTTTTTTTTTTATTAATTTTITTKKPTTTKQTTTVKPTTTTTLKPIKLQVPDLLLDPLLPPLFDNEIVAKDEVVLTATTTEKPAAKTTKKSYYQQQQQHHIKQLAADAAKDLKDFNISKSSLKTTEKHVAGTKAPPKPVNVSKEKLRSNIETLTKQNVAKQVAAAPLQRRIPNKQTNYKNDKQYNYNFDLYIGSTTPRPAKTGLPTITPFPHRLRS